jgi:hypothetical protein
MAEPDEIFIDEDGGRLSTDVPDGTRPRQSMCETCVFRPVKNGGIDLTPGRRAEIEAYLIQGHNQLCHHDDNTTICRGSRNFQLQLWHRMGIITEPTDQALREAMRSAGVEPKEHI